MNRHMDHLRVKTTSIEIWMVVEQSVGLECKWKEVEGEVVLIW